MNPKLPLISLLIIPLLIIPALLLRKHNESSKINKLNVILISIDSLRADHMSTYGYKRTTTPEIDTWAKNASVFKNFFSTSYLTPISESSVHTGQYPLESGIINFQSVLASSTPTLGQILSQNGWSTAAFGTSPEFLGYPAGINLQRGLDNFDIQPSSSANPYNGRSGNAIRKSIAWIASSTQSTKPFFLWLPLGSVHWPYGQDEPIHFGDPKYDGIFANTSQRNTWNQFGYLYKNRWYDFDKKTRDIFFSTSTTERDIDFVISRYDDGILRTDRMLGELFRYLKDNDLEKNTLVILQSEHGEGFGERGYILHYDIYDEQTHVPLIIKVPSQAGSEVAQLASGVDVLPTILEILNIRKPKLYGVSLLPVMNDRRAKTRPDLFITRTSLWERVLAPGGFPQLQGFLEADNREHFYDTAIRSEKWKLIHRLSRETQARWSWLNNLTDTPIVVPEYELYDIKNDPQETNNLYKDTTDDNEILSLKERLTVQEGFWKQNLPGKTPEQEIQPYFQ